MVAYKPQVNIDIVINFTILSPRNTFCAPNFDRKEQPDLELMKVFADFTIDLPQLSCERSIVKSALYLCVNLGVLPI